MPHATPATPGRPRTTPTLAPTAVSSVLLGPGVPATTTENARKARVCSGVTDELRPVAASCHNRASPSRSARDHRQAPPLASVSASLGFIDSAPPGDIGRREGAPGRLAAWHRA